MVRRRLSLRSLARFLHDDEKNLRRNMSGKGMQERRFRRIMTALGVPKSNWAQFKAEDSDPAPVVAIDAVRKRSPRLTSFEMVEASGAALQILCGLARQDPSLNHPDYRMLATVKQCCGEFPLLILDKTTHEVTAYFSVYYLTKKSYRAITRGEIRSMDTIHTEHLCPREDAAVVLVAVVRGFTFTSKAVVLSAIESHWLTVARNFERIEAILALPQGAIRAPHLMRRGFLALPEGSFWKLDRPDFPKGR